MNGLNALWFICTVDSVVQTVASASVAALLELPEEAQYVNEIAKAILGRALGTNFGSSAVASLMVAVERVLRFLFAWTEHLEGTPFYFGGDGQCIIMLIMCCGLVGRVLFPYFHPFGMVHVGLYGKSYGQATADTSILADNPDYEQIGYDQIVGGCLFSGQLCISIVSAGLLFWTEEWVLAKTGNFPHLLDAACLSFIVSGCVGQVIRASVIGSLVAFVNDFRKFAGERPKVYQSIVDRYPKVDL